MICYQYAKKQNKTMFTLKIIHFELLLEGLVLIRICVLFNQGQIYLTTDGPCHFILDITIRDYHASSVMTNEIYIYRNGWRTLTRNLTS